MCREALPEGTAFERVPCSTSGCAPDLIARIAGTGSGRLMLLGHVDTVISHAAHRPVERDGERLYGSGTADMKGGVAVSLALARELAAAPDDFGELALLLVCDEEWRTAPFSHVGRFADYDACLCFEAGERASGRDGYEEGVIVRRKGAGMLRVLASGRAAHSGSAPQDGRNALLALAHTAIDLAAISDPAGPDRLTVVPTIVESGSGLNVVPATGELVFDLRADDTAAFRRVIEAVPPEVGGATLEAGLERVWPAMDSSCGGRRGDCRGRRVARRPDRRAGKGRRQRREPLRRGDPGDTVRPGSSRWRSPHPTGVHSRRLSSRTDRRLAGGRARGSRRLGRPPVRPAQPIISTWGTGEPGLLSGAMASATSNHFVYFAFS